MVDGDQAEQAKQAEQAAQADKPTRRAAPTESAWWTAIGVLFVWVVAMALWQKGVSGYFTSFLLLYAVGLAVFGVLVVTRLLVRFALPIAAIVFLILWLAVGGTYSAWRDAVAILLIVPAVLCAFPESRLWLRRLPASVRVGWRLWRRAERRRNSPAAVARNNAQLAAMKNRLAEFAQRHWESWRREHRLFKPVNAKEPTALPINVTVEDTEKVVPSVAVKAAVNRRLAPLVVAVCALVIWVGLSGLDYLLSAQALPRNGGVLRPAAMPPEFDGVRVGVALSGGGYRAALVHAGVVDALGQLGVPVTHLSSVSGGSIIGSFLSVGGSPKDFLQAVAAGRFRMTRDLMAFQNLLRLPSPARAPGLDVELWPFFDNFSRLDVQAALVDRVLLRGDTMPSSGPALGPALMVCMTDLTSGISVGAMNDGYLLAGPTSKRFFRAPEAIALPGLARLADRVAVSGSFPGAFPALQVHARITTVPEPLSRSHQGNALPLLLADGGIRDNLGLKLLEAADELARDVTTVPAASGWTGFNPSADWALDLILVSDGGKFFRSESDSGVLAGIKRAIDLSGLETGVLRAMRSTPERPLVVLSALSSVAPSPDALILGKVLTSGRERQYEYFRPDLLDQATLSKIVALVPDQAAAQVAWTAYQAVRKGPAINVQGIDERCAGDSRAANASRECVWWRLVSLVGQDIWQTTETFIHTPTLSDAFAPGQAESVYRFGQYLVYLKSPEIRSALLAAAENRRATVQGRSVAEKRSSLP